MSVTADLPSQLLHRAITVPYVCRQSASDISRFSIKLTNCVMTKEVTERSISVHVKLLPHLDSKCLGCFAAVIGYTLSLALNLGRIAV